MKTIKKPKQKCLKKLYYCDTCSNVVKMERYDLAEGGFRKYQGKWIANGLRCPYCLRIGLFFEM